MRGIAGCGFVVMALLLLAAPAKAWNAAGHRIVAALAWRQLPPEVQGKIVALLRKHPAYAAAWRQELSEAKEREEEMALFLRAASWSDEVEVPGSPYRHAAWRFLAHPYVPSRCRSRFHPADDVRADSLVEQITLRQDSLHNLELPDKERAISLCWLIFLTGEAHQPLSCATLVSPAFPHSDHNGHDFTVRTSRGPVSLHTFWDSLPGGSAESDFVHREATRLGMLYPRTRLPELAAKEPEAWGWESAALAEKAYRHGALQGSANPARAPALPEGYAKEAHARTDRQLALAAYRLADLLNTLFPDLP